MNGSQKTLKLHKICNEYKQSNWIKSARAFYQKKLYMKHAGVRTTKQKFGRVNPKLQARKCQHWRDVVSQAWATECTYRQKKASVRLSSASFPQVGSRAKNNNMVLWKLTWRKLERKWAWHTKQQFGCTFFLLLTLSLPFSSDLSESYIYSSYNSKLFWWRQRVCHFNNVQFSYIVFTTKQTKGNYSS